MVSAVYSVDGNKHTLSVVGHANYDEYGKDIVCAGISALVQSLIWWIEENYYKGENIIIDAKEGAVIVSCEGGDDISAVFNMTAIGLTQIADGYPSHAQIDIIGTAD